MELEASDSNSFSMSTNETGKANPNVQIVQDGKVVKKVQKTRQRRILSCVYCHSKKIKCDRQKPCSQCTKLGMECKYFINERISRGGKKSSRLTADEKKLRGLMNSANENKKAKQESVETAKSQDTQSLLSSSPTNSSTTSTANPLAPSSSIATSIEEVEQQQFDTAPNTKDYTANPNQSQQEQLGIEDETFKTPLGLDISVSLLGFLNKPEASSNSNSLRSFTANVESPFSGADPFAIGGLIQSPMVNQATNSMTSSYFNHNFTTQATNHNNSINGANNQINFNSSSFPLANLDVTITFSSHANSPTMNFSERLQQQQQQQQQIPPRPESASIVKTQPQSSTLYNSLNGYTINTATSVNYLYGTNTYGENSTILNDITEYLPTDKDRSFELIDRYLNSVHLLLPIVVNMKEFLVQHKLYWEIKSRRDSTTADLNNPRVESPGSSHHSGDGGNEPMPSDSNFNYIQFYTLYLPILYASTISEFEEYDNLLLNQEIHKYLMGFKICKKYYNFPEGIKTIPLLLGNVIIQSTSPNPSTMEMAQIIRYAKFLHFHKDPWITLRIKDPEIIKFRRLLWWVIFGLDALSSHNFCLPPNCRSDDFNVLMPDEEEFIGGEKKLNVSIVSMNIKFGYDILLSEIVYHLHNGLCVNINCHQINQLKQSILSYQEQIKKYISKMDKYFQLKQIFADTLNHSPIQLLNVVNFVKIHSWSFLDRALMLLHKKILLGTPKNHNHNDEIENEIVQLGLKEPVMQIRANENPLSLCKFEDTYGQILEANIITNFNNSSISLLKFGDFENFSYGDLANNLIPSILHNFNDFLLYNDFIKFGKFNWFIKRTIPIDSVILLMIIISVKFKYQFITTEELSTYKNLINSVMYIINRKWFKNEKYKRMLSLTNMTWEYLLKKFDVNDVIAFDVKNSEGAKDLVSVNIMDTLQLKEKILYDLRHNFIDVVDYCSFYSSLENLLNELIKYIESK